MGRTRTPAYRVEFKTERGYMTPSAWNVKGYGQVPGNGKPTSENLDAYVTHMNASFAPGGVNEQAGEQIGQIVAAELIRQQDGATMALWVDASYVERKVAERKAIA